MPTRSVTANDTIEPFRLLKNNGGKLEHATAASDLVVAASDKDGAAADEKLAAHVTPCTIKLTAGAAITKYAPVMCGAAGKVVPFVAGANVYAQGIALEEASGDGVRIEVAWDRPLSRDSIS